MLILVNEINKVNLYIVSYLIVCYKYVIILIFIILFDVYCLFFYYYFLKKWFMNCCYEIIIYIYSRCIDIFDRLYFIFV